MALLCLRLLFFRLKKYRHPNSKNDITDFSKILNEKYLNQKDWIDSTVQKNPSDADYQLIGTVSASQPNFAVDVILKAPGGKTLWSESYGASLRQINQLGDTVANTISEKVFMEIMKVRDKYSKS
mgnify:CR=1 FL=1